MQLIPRPPFDAAIVGYPKCGNTWLQMMVRKALVLAHGLGDAWIPRIIGPRETLPAGVPTVAVTHAMPHYNTQRFDEPFVDLQPFHGRPVVLLVRDAADALVSLWMHNVHRERTPLFTGDVDAMVHDPIYGIDKFLAFHRAWFEHRHAPSSLLLLRYEDLRRSPHAEVTRLLHFLLGAAADADLVHAVVAFGAFENMRRLEDNDHFGLSTLAPAPGGEAARKVRRGEVGGAARQLRAETLAYIHGRIAVELPGWYGYPHAAYAAGPAAR